MLTRPDAAAALDDDPRAHADRCLESAVAVGGLPALRSARPNEVVCVPAARVRIGPSTGEARQGIWCARRLTLRQSLNPATSPSSAVRSGQTATTHSPSGYSTIRTTHRSSRHASACPEATVGSAHHQMVAASWHSSACCAAVGGSLALGELRALRSPTVPRSGKTVGKLPRSSLNIGKKPYGARWSTACGHARMSRRYTPGYRSAQPAHRPTPAVGSPPLGNSGLSDGACSVGCAAG